MDRPDYTLGQKFRLIAGTYRRLLWNYCRPGYVRRNLAARRGECKRCGVCCRLAWRCRCMAYVNGLPTCSIYNTFRLRNCSNFPIDRRDLADRDIVAPGTVCGYYWDEPAHGTKQR